MKTLNSLSIELRKNPKKWLVTGVAGFIGSNILEFLLDSDQEVIGLDNFSTGSPENLADVKSKVGKDKWNKFHFIEGDLRDKDLCIKACSGVDYILHQGALGSVPRSIKDPITSNDVNVNGTLNIFWAAKESNVRRVIYASSSSVYGDDPELPKREEKVGNPLSPYAVTKKVNEIYARVFSLQYDLEIVGIRYFNVFGPRQNPNGPYAAVIPKWISAMINGEEVVIHGDGSTSRDFTFVDNVVALNILSAISNIKIEKGLVINGALGDTTSLNELFEMLRSGLEKRFKHLNKFQPKYSEFRAGDIKHSQANMDRASLIFNYSPLIKVSEGIEKTLNWYVNL